MIKPVKKQFLSVILALCLISIVSCDNNYYPKPIGFFRIDLPQKSYALLDTNLPYSFEYPTYAIISRKAIADENPWWINLEFPQFKGTLYLSHKIVDHNLDTYIEDTRTMVMKHIPKATGIESSIYENQESKVYGMTFTIDGMDAASPLQFYLTDSSRNFLRGALYFNTVPNNDSLQPVIEFLTQDVHHLIETLRWKDQPSEKQRN